MSALDTRSSARSDAPGAADDAGSDTGRGESTRHLVRMRYMPGLDGLRAFAVTGVLLYHATLNWIPGGFLGVDVFFVISGYLITSLLLAEFRNQGRIGLGQFYLRRARRLLPALFLLLGVVGLFTVVFLPDEVTKLRGDIVAALFYGTNWWQIFHNLSYFEAVGRPPMLQHLWSLAVEEQFYLVWPLLLTAMFKLWHGRRRPMLLATLGMIVLSSGLMIGLSIHRGYPLSHDPSRVYYGTDTRAFTMLIGAVLAMVWAPWRLSDKLTSGGRIVLDVVGFGSLAGLAWMFLNVNEFSADLYRGGFLVCSILAALVIAVTVHPAADLSRLLGLKPFRWIGERSYGIYLWHWPVFMVTRPVLDIGLTGTPNLILRLAVTVAIAELSYRYVEQPIRQGALSRWFKALRSSTGSERISMAARTTVICGSLLLGVVLVTIGLANGQPAPIPPGLDLKAAAQTSATTLPLPAPTTTTVAGAVPPPPTAAPNPAIARVTLIGDSVMVGAETALVQALGPVRIDAAVSRQFGTAIDILRAIKASGQLSDTVVVHMGTNGVITQGHMDAIMDILKDRKLVVFVNLKVPRSWEGIDNATLASNVAKYPNAKLIDWHTIGNAHPEYFYEDGIHLNPTGQRAYAALIAQQVNPNP